MSRLKNVVSVVALSLLVSVGSAHAATVGPPPEAKLTPPGSSSLTMAASKDGTTVVTADSAKGNVFVWVRGSASWADAHPVMLKRPAHGNGFGTTIAVAPNGRTIVATTETAIYVYARPSGGWSSAARSVSLGKGPGHPTVVAVTGGGRDIFVVGNRAPVMFDRVSHLKFRSSVLPFADVTAVSDNGRALVAVGNSVRLFVRSSVDERWPKTARTTLSLDYDPSGVALSWNGATIAVGLGDSQSGRDGVLVFAEPQAGWASTAKPSARLSAERPQINEAGVPEALGGTIAISRDGSEVVAGTQIGTRVLLFRRTLDGWHNEHEDEQWNLPGDATGSQELAWSRPTQTMFVTPDSTDAAYVYGA